MVATETMKSTIVNIWPFIESLLIAILEVPCGAPNNEERRCLHQHDKEINNHQHQDTVTQFFVWRGKK